MPKPSHLWSGRFESDPDQTLVDFGASFRFDRRLLEDDVAGSIAWAEALAAAGALSEPDLLTIVRGLDEIRDEGRRDPAFVDGPDEDVHSFVERQLVERVGEVGKRLHTGRSRNEQVSVDIRLYLKRRIPALQIRVARLVAALALQAGRSGEALMPSYTHLRRAQPVLVAHFFLAHAVAFKRDHGLFGQAREQADVLPLGSGAIAGTNYAIDTAALARRLGFGATVSNSIDAASDRDFLTQFLFACAQAMVHVSRMAEDLILFTSEEFGFFELADAAATGSSLMPQKKNPDPLELARGKAGRTIGHLAGWLATVKGLASGYNKDLQEDKEAVFDAEDTVAASVAAVAQVVTTLTLNVTRTEQAAAGLSLATDVADHLVARGMPFRQAHEVVGGIVRSLIAEGRDFRSLSMDEWRRFSELFDEQVRERVSAAASVAAKRTPQSTNPAAVRHALGDLELWLSSLSPGQ
ncbi:MAG: argininosuccinate lyase [Acidobacteria bacterium]|nr:argininosuccinate lyase [Acidobacteriota bacterium]